MTRPDGLAGDHHITDYMIHLIAPIMCHSMLPSVSARASSDSALSAGKSPAWGTSWDDLCEHNVAPNPTAVASKLKVHAFPMVVDPVTAAAAQAPAASAGVLLHINTTATTSTGPRFTMVHGGIGTRIDVPNAPIGSGASSIISASGAAMSAVSAAFPRPPVTSQYGALSSAGGQGAPASIQHHLGTDSKHQRAHTKLEDQEARCIDTGAGACALPGSGRSTNGSSGASEWSATTRVDAGRDSACIPAASLLCSPDDSVDNMSVCASQSPRAEGKASCGSAAAAAPTADVHAKAAATATLLSAVTRQLLERAATRRPGAQSLTAAPPSAPRSARSRLLVTQLSVYPCAHDGGGCCGDAALAHANRLLSLGMLPGTRISLAINCITPCCWMCILSFSSPATQTCLVCTICCCTHCLNCPSHSIAALALLPLMAVHAYCILTGGIQYMPVVPGSFMLRAGRAWQFPAYVLCLASSYMQRVLVALPQLSDAARAVTGFEEHLPTASKVC